MSSREDYNQYWSRKYEILVKYDSSSQTYEELYEEEQSKKFDSVLEAYSKPRGKLALDCGCGTGLLIRKIAGVFKVVVGVDCSKAMLRLAKKKSSGMGNVHLILADLDFLPISKAACEVVFSFTVLQLSPKPSKTIGEFRRVLKNNGELAVSVLKVAVNKGEIINLLQGGGFSLLFWINRVDVKDYVALCRAI